MNLRWGIIRLETPDLDSLELALRERLLCAVASNTDCKVKNLLPGHKTALLAFDVIRAPLLLRTTSANRLHAAASTSRAASTRLPAGPFYAGQVTDHSRSITNHWPPRRRREPPTSLGREALPSKRAAFAPALDKYQMGLMAGTTSLHAPTAQMVALARSLNHATSPPDGHLVDHDPIVPELLPPSPRQPAKSQYE
ncbi:hypothetical protein CMUS01_02310 [Colletotrichum musicola]|uniref:Uncharacterized protein n=1 Tax=Colletotrichum musicola TaxID=2175873 RepID=A0A8H6NV99_9PEZI|nr:hypothetical protein CMUS01_02310 [Colletotrichum musicola]